MESHEITSETKMIVLKKILKKILPANRWGSEKVRSVVSITITSAFVGYCVSSFAIKNEPDEIEKESNE